MWHLQKSADTASSMASVLFCAFRLTHTLWWQASFLVHNLFIKVALLITVEGLAICTLWCHSGLQPVLHSKNQRTESAAFLASDGLCLGWQEESLHVWPICQNEHLSPAQTIFKSLQAGALSSAAGR